MKIAIIGAGGWGTALGCVIATKQDKVNLWCYEQETADEIAINRTNKDFLPTVELPDNIESVTDFDFLKNTDIIINTVPTQHIRSVYENIIPLLTDKIVVNASKGIEKISLLRPSEIFFKLGVKSDNYVVMSGPSHAEEVATGTPTALVVASNNFDLAKQIRDILNTNIFRLYSSADVIGCELGGALKNVIAIAYGVIHAQNCGDNTKAMLITRGAAEITRLGIACGANSETFNGLSGLGDLIVTCLSKYSRNRNVGELLVKGMSLQEIKQYTKMVAEGIETVISANALAQKFEIDMPISKEVYEVLYCGGTLENSLPKLMMRETKNEQWQ